MAETRKNSSLAQEWRAETYLLWFVWGVLLSLTTICSLALLALLIPSILLNLYLGWELSGVEITISRPMPISAEAVMPTPTGPLAVMRITASPSELEPTSTPMPVATESPLEAQINLLAAIATEATPLEPISTPTPGLEASIATSASMRAAVATAPSSAAGSKNAYTLIPFEGERGSKSAAEDADLNLKLREPSLVEAELSLIDMGGPDHFYAPQLSGLFEPNFVAGYAVHTWDWTCNCKGPSLKDVDMVGIATTPGQPVYIPRRQQGIYQGQYYALLLYASENSLTFEYDRDGTVATGYTVHYQGLQTDPNLLALYRQSQGNELPGLTLDTPVGITTDELVVAVRDRGAFMDVRSKKFWRD